MAHEFAHNCGRSEASSDEIEEWTFQWWKNIYDVDGDWTHGCPCLDRKNL